MINKIKLISLILFFLLPISLFSFDRVDLVKNCSDSKTCTPRVWYAIDSYDPSFLQIQNPGVEWKKIESFPIWMNKLFTKEGELAPAEEKWICQWAKKNKNSEAVFVTGWSAKDKTFKFYHRASEADPETAARGCQGCDASESARDIVF